MQIDQSNINDFLNKYVLFTDRLSTKYNYPNNIRHVLYLIIPAFIIKYGLKYENMILDCFDKTKIYISPVEDKVCTAFFTRKLQQNQDQLPKYYSIKFIVLNQYHGISLIEMLDNIVHEFNHAVNSMLNEIKYDDKKVSMRTGLSYMTFNVSNLNDVIDKTSDITLEEIINTKQTEDIINIINSFGQYQIENIEFNNTFYTLKHEIDEHYTSNAYILQSLICKELMHNKTFIPTIENLRLNGNVDDIDTWFDNVTGTMGSYHKLTNLLESILKMEQDLAKAKWFKQLKINKIRSKISQVMSIIEDYDKNCIFK